MEANPAPFFLVDTNGVILRANKALATATACPVEELNGKCYFDFLDEGSGARRRGYLKEAVQGKRQVRFQDRVTNRYYENYFQPILEGDGSIRHLAIQSIDVTDRLGFPLRSSDINRLAW